MFFKKKVIIKLCEFKETPHGCVGNLIVKIPKQKDETLHPDYLYPYEDVKILNEILWQYWGHDFSTSPEMNELSKHHRVSFKLFGAKNFDKLLQNMDKEVNLIKNYLRKVLKYNKSYKTPKDQVIKWSKEDILGQNDMYKRG